MEEKERFEILLEHIAKDVRTVAEGHISLNQKIDRNHAEAKELNRETNLKLDVITQTLAGKIEQVDRKVEINQKKIEQVDQKVDLNREAIERNREAIERNREAIDLNRRKIENVDEKLSSGLEKYADHEERIRVLEVIN